MSRRGYATSDLYEERDREFYAPRRGGGRTAEYDEIDIRERRRESGRQPDFLREDYGRSSNVGQLVVRDSKREDLEYSRERPRPRDTVKETDEQIYIHKGGREPDRPKYRSTDARTDRAEIGTSYRRADTPEPEIREEIIYRDRERDYAPPRQQIAREQEEFVFRKRERERDYVPPPPQIAREREEFVFRPKQPAYEREEITIRDRDREPDRPRERDFREDELIIRRNEKERSRPQERDRYDDREQEIIIRRDEKERDRPRGRDRYEDREEEIIIRRNEDDRPKPRARSYERESLTVRDDRSTAAPRAKSRDYHEEDITIRRSERDRASRARSRDTRYSEEDIIIRRDEREARRPRSRSLDHRDDELVIRRSSYSREREKPRARSRGRGGDEEDIIIRHSDDKRKGHKDEVIIRRNERSPSLESYRPPPEPEPVRAPPIHQEIITHHRHIDHGT